MVNVQEDRYTRPMNDVEIHLETDRLAVRRYEERDVPDILSYSQCDEADLFRRRNIGWEFSVDSVRNWWTPMATMLPNEATVWLSLVIELKAEQRVIGNVGFNVKPIGSSLQGQIGWTLGAADEGHGYATEAAAVLLDYLFGKLCVHRVCALSSPRNKKSWRLMERLGMRREAHFRKSCNHDGSWEDEVVYALLAEEWHGRSGSFDTAEKLASP